MECGDSRSGGEISPELLELIPGRGGGGSDEKRNFGGSEERKLELKLGPPGEEDWFINGNNNNNNKDIAKSSLDLGGSSSKTLNSTTKRGCQDTIDEKTETKDETWGKNSNWCSTSSSKHHHQQQHNPSFLRFPQSQSTVPKDSSQKNDSNKKVLSTPATSFSPANATITNTTSQKRTAAAPVVGWPPVRSFRKKLTKPAPSTGSPNEVPLKENKAVQAESAVKKGLFVNINMDGGVPIGRKVDLNAYGSYEKLSPAIYQLFRNLLAVAGSSAMAARYGLFFLLLISLFGIADPDLAQDAVAPPPTPIVPDHGAHAPSGIVVAVIVLGSLAFLVFI